MRAGAIPVPIAATEDARAEAFRRLVGDALDASYRRATLLLGDRFEAEDAVHDAAERAWRRWGDLRDPAAFEAWFGRILVNVCRDRMRRRRRVAFVEVTTQPEETADPAPSRRLAAVDEQSQIRQALDALTPDERTAVVLRFESDLTVPQIARMTGAREGTIKSRLHHALRKLRAVLEREEADR